MDRRRALSQRPASSEEIQCWSHASNALSALKEKYTNPSTAEAILRVNRLITAWPTMNDDNLPLDGFESVKTIYKKLNPSLLDIKATAETEVNAIDQALEAVSVLIALRKAPEPNLPPEKRNKRRGSSPASAPATPPLVPNRITLNVRTDKDRTSEGPPPASNTKRDWKSRSRLYSKQHPLVEGRKVAFQQPTKNEGGDADDNTWILAVVTKCLSSEKHRYEVQDAEPQDNGQPGQVYPAYTKTMIPLPDPEALRGTPAHPDSYPEFPTGSTVMALYPDTSCFYRAEVVASPKDLQNSRTAPSKSAPMYRLRFEDDDDQTHAVAAQWVVEWPSS